MQPVTLGASLSKKLHAMWDNLPVRYRGAIVVAIPVACLAVTLSAWVWSRQNILDIRQRIDRTTLIIATMDQLLIELLNAETSVRGYSITNDVLYLAPYQQAEANLPKTLRQLEQITQPSPARQQNFKAIENLVLQDLSILDQIITVVEAQETLANKAQLLKTLLYRNRQTMDDIREQVGSIQATEQRTLTAYLEQRQTLQELTTYILGFTAGVSLLGSLAALYLFSRVDDQLQRREQLLRESNTLLKAIVTNVVDGVLTLDGQGKIELFNATATTMFGYESLEVVGQPLGLLLAETAIAPLSPLHDGTLHDGTLPDGPHSILRKTNDLPPRFWNSHSIQLNRPWQTTGIRKNGSTFPIEISLSEMQIDQRLIAIIRDITDFQETEAKLQSRADRLAQLTANLGRVNAALEDRNQELEQFAYVTSHDLKAPLRAIANLSEWIEEDLAGQLPEENQQQMRLLRGRVHRMEALINGLLEYSRVGRTQTTTEQIDVADLLAEVIDSLDPPDAFTVHVDPNMPTLMTKRMPLRQVFANLIGNGIKHHDRDDGQIQISVQDQGDWVEFAVADDGPGIHPDYHQKIFAIFQTLQARDTRENTGVGLAIVKKTVETEGGSIRVESAEGAGATFYFTWPKQAAGA
jgi:signal transduction histidine kinase/CHASE3 domain sensor protein